MPKPKGPRAHFSSTPRHYVVMRAIMASGVSSTQRLVLFALEGHVTYLERESGRCWPSWQTLAESTGLSRASVAKALAELESSGWVEVTRRSGEGGQESNVYRVTPPHEQDRPPVH